MRVLLAATVALLLASGLAATAQAQSASTALARPPAAALDPVPNPTPTPTSTSSASTPSRSSSTSSNSSLPVLSQDQANGLFDGFLSHGFLIATDGIRQGLQRLVDDTNLVTNTSATWTYQQPTVVALQSAVQTGANAALGLLIFWLGLNVLLRPQLGGAYTEPHEVIPRLMLGAGLANSAPHWTALAIDVNNSVCANLLAVNSGSLGDILSGFPVFDHTWLLGLLLVAFLLVWIWLLLKMAWRMGLLMVLLVLAPAAQLCWVLPQTRGFADRWHEKFWTTLYAQVVVTVALKLAWGFAGNAGSNPIALLITICLLFLAANSPELLASGAARIGLGGLVDSAMLMARTAGSGGSAGVAPAAAAGAGAAGGALAGVGGGTSVSAGSVPHVSPTANTVSGQSSGTGGGVAASNKAGYGRGGRSIAAEESSSWAATNKGSRSESAQRAANV